MGSAFSSISQQYSFNFYIHRIYWDTIDPKLATYYIIPVILFLITIIVLGVFLVMSERKIKRLLNPNCSKSHSWLSLTVLKLI